jgi:hypothetical protein
MRQKVIPEKIIIKKKYKLGWLVNLFYIIAHIPYSFNLKDEQENKIYIGVPGKMFAGHII